MLGLCVRWYHFTKHSGAVRALVPLHQTRWACACAGTTSPSWTLFDAAFPRLTTIVALSNDVPVLGCTIHSGTRISYSPFVKQEDVRSLSRVYRHAKCRPICHTGYVSQEVHIICDFFMWTTSGVGTQRYLFPLLATHLSNITSRNR